MKYDVVKQSLEQFVTTNWPTAAGSPTPALQYDNVDFNSQLYTEYAQLTVRFGDSVKRSLPVGCYRQFGMVIFTIKTKPGRGSARKLQLASAASGMLTDAIVLPVTPLVAPTVNLKETDLFDDTRERDGFVMAQVSCPFYYDWSN